MWLFLAQQAENMNSIILINALFKSFFGHLLEEEEALDEDDMMVFLVSRRFRVNFVFPLEAKGFEDSSTLGFVASLIASPLDLMLMTARVITTGPEDRGSSLWLLVSESGR